MVLTLRTARAYILLTVLLTVLASVGLLVEKNGRQKIDPDTERWEEQILQTGPEAAWRTLVANAQNTGGGHFQAHHFGAALYALYGMSRISACGDEFEYGCLHELYGRAIADKGLAALDDARAYCNEIESEHSLCHHGIGHGLVSFLGYEEPNMLESVAECKQGVSSADAGKCVAGVLMEYMDRTMLSGEGGPFPVSLDEPYAACASVPDEYKSLCVFELPRVWRKALWPDAATSSAAISLTVDLCEGLPEERLHTACFGGVGSEFYRQTRRDAEAARSLCKSFVADERGKTTCIQQVASMDALRAANEPDL